MYRYNTQVPIKTKQKNLNIFVRNKHMTLLQWTSTQRMFITKHAIYVQEKNDS